MYFKYSGRKQSYLSHGWYAGNNGCVNFELIITGKRKDWDARNKHLRIAYLLDKYEI